MSAKFKLFLILTLSIFAAAAGVYVIQHQPAALINVTANEQQQQLAVEKQSSEFLAYPERSHYKIIPLESINSTLQGSDPAALALNALDEVASGAKIRKVEVAYPQPNQALVTITQVKPTKDNSVRAIRYRMEMSRFGRSLLVSSPPIWEIIWVGSQVQCFSSSQDKTKFTNSCR
ncbi:hypothetical protein [Anabaena sp. PCC 7108]|uniref:hypothetical protein n=1 Tax=Anabaena sp. PCC 7108 TaxID=163908 RepID=UPI00037FE34F|nr:hypothetical protein [Anabaena sp. PCC 7108]